MYFIIFSTKYSISKRKSWKHLYSTLFVASIIIPSTKAFHLIVFLYLIFLIKISLTTSRDLS